jgi:hypothetical protein
MLGLVPVILLGAAVCSGFCYWLSRRGEVAEERESTRQRRNVSLLTVDGGAARGRACSPGCGPASGAQQSSGVTRWSTRRGRCRARCGHERRAA